MEADPFEGPAHDVDKERPTVRAAYGGECGVCFGDFDEGDEIRALPGGDGWEAVDHGHDYDPGELLPSAPAPVEQVVLPPADPELYAALAGPQPETGPAAEQDAVQSPSGADPAVFTCTECPKTYAPTKNQRVRLHKIDGVPCPGGGEKPRELLPADDGPRDSTGTGTGPDPWQTDTRWPESQDPDAKAALEKAAQASPSVAAMRARIASGRTGRVPAAAGLVEAAKAMAGTPYMLALGEAVGNPGTVLDMLPGTVLDMLESAVSSLDKSAPSLSDSEGLREDSPPDNRVPYTDPSGVEWVIPPEDAERLAREDAETAQQLAPEPSWTWEYRAPEPEPERDSYGRYKLPHPQTYAPVNWRRATTFAGVLADTFTLDAWQKRHLVRGAAMHPDQLAGAGRLDIREDKPVLDRLAEELASLSGVHTAAEQGTYVHALTEDIDRELDPDARNAAWSRVPEKYLADVRAYQRALDQAGLRVVPSMLERRTCVTGYKVAGTFDQVLYLTRDIPGLGSRGDYVIGDKKTGSTVTEYGSMGEYTVQLWLYAYGLATSGVWDGHANRWVPSVPVRQDKGVIIHIPLGLGECTLHAVDLEQGRKSAALCQQVFDWRTFVKARRTRLSVELHSVRVPKETAPVTVPAPPAAPAPADSWQSVDWKARVREVMTQDDAKDVYDAAVLALMPGDVVEQLADALTSRRLFRTKWGGLYTALERVTPETAGKLWNDAQAAGYPEMDDLTERIRAALTPAAQTSSVDWEAHARSVVYPQDAGKLWTAARQDPAVSPERLDALVQIMKAALDEPPF